MPRAGPKRTILRPSERAVFSRRWPLQLLIGVGVVCALFLVLRLLSGDAERPDEESGSHDSAAPQIPAPNEPREKRLSAEPASGAQTAAADAEFVSQLERTFARRFLAGTPYTAEVADLLAGARIAEAAALLESRAAVGDRDATVVLVFLNGLCESQVTATSWQEGFALSRGQIEAEQARAAPVPVELRRRIEASLAVEQRRQASVSRACRDARFDSAMIGQRLRTAAEAGHEASLWVLGHRTDDVELRNKYWLSAAMLGYPAAQADLAGSLLQENLQGDRRNRGRMNFWLQAAAKHSPRAKQALGECLLNGCNAQPPDAESAVPWLREAATLGELAAFDALASISKSDPSALSDEELYGLQSFLEQLNDMGCYGAAMYPTAALKSLSFSREISSRLSPHGLEQAQQLAAANWHSHGAAARQAQGCD